MFNCIILTDSHHVHNIPRYFAFMRQQLQFIFFLITYGQADMQTNKFRQLPAPQPERTLQMCEYLVSVLLFYDKIMVHTLNRSYSIA